MSTPTEVAELIAEAVAEGWMQIKNVDDRQQLVDEVVPRVLAALEAAYPATSEGEGLLRQGRCRTCSRPAIDHTNDHPDTVNHWYDPICPAPLPSAGSPSREQVLKVLWDFEATDFEETAGYSFRDQQRLADDILAALLPTPTSGETGYLHDRTASTWFGASASPSVVGEVTVEEACEVMHDAYEKAAVGAGWETQAASRKPWADVPEANKQTMRAAVSALTALLASRGGGDTATLTQPESVTFHVDGRQITLTQFGEPVTSWRALGALFDEHRVLYDLIDVADKRTLDAGEQVVDGRDYVTARKAATS